MTCRGMDCLSNYKSGLGIKRHRRHEQDATALQHEGRCWTGSNGFHGSDIHLVEGFVVQGLGLRYVGKGL